MGLLSSNKSVQALLTYVGTDDEKMRSILTYTYVNSVVANNTEISITLDAYKKARNRGVPGKDVVAAEKRLS